MPKKTELTAKRRDPRRMATLKERRKTDRERQKRWRERQKNDGRKQVSAMLSLKAQIILNREKRRTNTTTSDVIERAILQLVEKPKGNESPGSP